MRAEAGFIGGKVIRSLETVTGCGRSGVTGWHQRHGNINVPIKVPRSALKTAQFAYSFMRLFHVHSTVGVIIDPVD